METINDLIGKSDVNFALLEYFKSRFLTGENRDPEKLKIWWDLQKIIADLPIVDVCLDCNYKKDAIRKMNEDLTRYYHGGIYCPYCGAKIQDGK